MDENEKMFNAQAALQNQNIDGQRSFNLMSQRNENQLGQAAILEQTNPNHILYDLELKLRGKRIDYKGHIIDGAPIMNELGVNRMMAFMSCIINQNTILSSLEDKEISNIIIRIGDDIIDDLTLNWEDYGITDQIMRDFIVNMILIPAFMSLKRAHHRNEKQWIGRSVIESISSSPKLPTEHKSFLSRFKP